MVSCIGARYGSSATYAFIACVLLNMLSASGDMHVGASTSVDRLPQVELDDHGAIEDGLGDQDDLAGYQDGWTGDRKTMRVRSVPAASTIMRRQARGEAEEVEPYYVDEALESEAVVQRQRPVRYARMKRFPKPSSHLPATAPAAPAPAPLPGNVELTLSWRAPQKELPALLAEVARVQKQEQSSQSNLGATPAPASDQDIDVDQDIEKAPSPMPVPSGDDATKGLPLFIATLLFLCCCCGSIGACIYYLCIKRHPSTASAVSAPLVPGNQGTETKRSYKEKRKEAKKGDTAGGDNNAPADDEGTKGETGSSGDTGTKQEEPAKVEEEEQHF